jgi:hypothetical protein
LSRTIFLGAFILLFFSKTSKKFEANPRERTHGPPKDDQDQWISRFSALRSKTTRFFFSASHSI